MASQIERARHWYDGLQSRERLLLLGAVLACLLVFWDTWWRQPQATALQRLTKQQASLQAELKGYELALKALDEATGGETDPAVVARNRLAELQQEMQSFEETARSLTSSGVISASEMAAALREILEANQHLKLVSLRNLRAEPVLSPGRQTGAGAQVYRHSVELRLEGRYLHTLSYMQALESLSWRLIWDELDIRMKEYPNAEIRLVISTLSLQPGVLGV